jgi:hypothetical protein
MKKNLKKNAASHPQTLPVHFEYSDSTAQAVCIAGSFNEWKPGSTPMILLGRGRWVKVVLLPPGVYEYRLVVDGEWMPDKRAEETALNPYGGLNSVVKVGPQIQLQPA